MSPALPPIPDALRALMAEIGPRWTTNRAGNIAMMIERFSEVLKESPRETLAIRRDIAYGPHPRQQFDLYLPPNGAANARRCCSCMAALSWTGTATART